VSPRGPDSPVARALAAIVGEAHVVRRAAALLVYESDGLPGYRHRPSLAVFPGSRDELVRVMRVLHAHGAPFVARGAGTGLSGGALADGVVLLGLHRLKRIIAMDPDARTATVEPGVVNATLTRAVAPFGLHYAPDPSSQTACTIGGNIAENAGGPHCLKYGVTLDHVLRATVVLPDGETVELDRGDGAGPGDGGRRATTCSAPSWGARAASACGRRHGAAHAGSPERVITLLADFTSVRAAAAATSR
jgi:FAD/FMN-containing dehydrogenase